MADTDDIQERIRRRAHELWEKEGRPQGRDADHWTQAEAEIRGSGTVEPTGKAAGSRRKAATSRTTRESTRIAAESLSEAARSPEDAATSQHTQPVKAAKRAATGTAVKSPRGPKKDGGKGASAG